MPDVNEPALPAYAKNGSGATCGSLDCREFALPALQGVPHLGRSRWPLWFRSACRELSGLMSYPEASVSRLDC